MDGVYGCNVTTGELDTQRYASPLPAIGLYIALASLLCSIMLASDIYVGFTRERLFPFKQRFACRWFNINAFTTTLLSIATKLPVDLNTPMPSPHDQLTKLSGTVMLSLSMAFFLPSFSQMGGEDMLSNVGALVVLVVTVIVNICIQMGTGVIYAFRIEHIVVVCLALSMLVNVINAAICSRDISKDLKKKLDHTFGSFEKRYKIPITAPPVFVHDVQRTVALCKESIPKRLFTHYARQAADVDYTMIRSANGSAAGVLSFLLVLVFIESEIRAFVSSFVAGEGRMMVGGIIRFCGGDSDYKWSTWAVMISQNIFILVMAIPLTFRWFHGMKGVTQPEKEIRKCRSIFKIELSRLRASYETLGEIQMGRLGIILRSRVTTPCVYLQVVASLISRAVSRTSFAPFCFFQRLRHREQLNENQLYNLGYNLASFVVRLDDDGEDFHDWMYQKCINAAVNEMDALTRVAGVGSQPLADVAPLENFLRVRGYDNTAFSLFLDKKNDLWETVVDFLDKHDQTGCRLQLSSLAFVIRQLCDGQQLSNGQPEALKQFVRAFQVLQPLLRHIDQYGFDANRESSWEAADWFLKEALDGLPNLQEFLPDLIQRNLDSVSTPDHRYFHAVAFYCERFVACEYLSRYESPKEVAFTPSTSVGQTIEEASRIVAGTLSKIFITITNSFPPIEKEQYNQAVYEANTNFFYHLDHLKEPLSPILFWIRPHLDELHSKLVSRKDSKRTLEARMCRNPYSVYKIFPDDLYKNGKCVDLFLVGALYVTYRLTALCKDPTADAATAREHVVHLAPYRRLIRFMLRFKEVNAFHGNHPHMMGADLLWNMLIRFDDGECAPPDFEPPDTPERLILRNLQYLVKSTKSNMTAPNVEVLKAVDEVMHNICDVIIKIMKRLPSLSFRELVDLLKQEAWFIVYYLFDSWLKETMNGRSSRGVK